MHGVRIGVVGSLVLVEPPDELAARATSLSILRPPPVSRTMVVLPSTVAEREASERVHDMARVGGRRGAPTTTAVRLGVLGGGWTGGGVEGHVVLRLAMPLLEEREQAGGHGNGDSWKLLVNGLSGSLEVPARAQAC